MSFSLDVPEFAYYLAGAALIVWAIGSAIGNFYSARLVQLEVQKLREARKKETPSKASP